MTSGDRREYHEITDEHYLLLQDQVLKSFAETFRDLKGLASTEPELHRISESLVTLRSLVLRLLQEAFLA